MAVFQVGELQRRLGDVEELLFRVGDHGFLKHCNLADLSRI